MNPLFPVNCWTYPVALSSFNLTYPVLYPPVQPWFGEINSNYPVPGAQIFQNQQPPQVSEETKNKAEKEPTRERIQRNPLRTNKKLYKKRKDENFLCRKQNKYRNLNSVILKDYPSWAVNLSKNAQWRADIYKSLGIETDVSDFEKFIVRNFPTQRTYVSLKHVRQLSTKTETPRENCLLLRVTLRRFLLDVAPLLALGNPKFLPQERGLQLATIRKLLQQLF